MGLCLLMAPATRGQQGPPLVASLGQNFGEGGGSHWEAQSLKTLGSQGIPQPSRPALCLL